MLLICPFLTFVIALSVALMIFSLAAWASPPFILCSQFRFHSFAILMPTPCSWKLQRFGDRFFRGRLVGICLRLRLRFVGFRFGRLGCLGRLCPADRRDPPPRLDCRRRLPGGARRRRADLLRCLYARRAQPRREPLPRRPGVCLFIVGCFFWGGGVACFCVGGVWQGTLLIAETRFPNTYNPRPLRSLGTALMVSTPTG